MNKLNTWERDQIGTVLAIRDDLLARGLISDHGYAFSRSPAGYWSADFTKAMTPKWKRLVRYWTKEHHARA